MHSNTHSSSFEWLYDENFENKNVHETIHEKRALNYTWKMCMKLSMKNVHELCMKNVHETMHEKCAWTIHGRCATPYKNVHKLKFFWNYKFF